MHVDHVELKELIRQRWNSRADSFDNCPGHGIHSEREKNDWVTLFKNTLGVNRLDILDVGAGTGVLSLLLAELGHNVTGVDIAEEMLEKAREKFNKSRLPGSFMVGDAENLPFADQSFDVVFNRHVVWSLPDPEKAFKEWKRVLKPGGKLIIIDGNWGKNIPVSRKAWRFFSQLLILLTEFRNPWPGHKRIDRQLPMKQKKRPEEDEKILRAVGFKVEVARIDIPRWNGFLGYLKYGYFRGMEFMVKADKI